MRNRSGHHNIELRMKKTYDRTTCRTPIYVNKHNNIMSHPTSHWERRMEHRFHVEIVTDTTTWNQERKDTEYDKVYNTNPTT